MSTESSNLTLSDTALIACPHCDLVQRLSMPAQGDSARCPRCNHEVWRRREDSLNRTAALSMAAALLWVVANAVPMLGLTVVGRQASTTIIGGAQHLWYSGDATVAVLVLFTAVIVPALEIIVMLTIVLGARREPVPEWVGTLLRHRGATRTWSLIEVMMLGVLVALVKIADYATVIPGTALFVLGALVAVLAGMEASFEPREVWEKIRWAQPIDGNHDSDQLTAEANSGTFTGMQQGLQACLTCGLLSRPAPGHDEGKCPRCGETLEFRKRASIQNAWAFLIAAAICYVPANLLPVLTTTTATGTESDTLLQGVVMLWSPIGWPLSLIVLVASIMIPSAKIVALAYLLIAVQRSAVRNNDQRTRLYRVVELIGRWSMVDVFVGTFTAALVQLQPLMSVEPGPGLVFFAAVVVLTMLAVESFDPRLIWDAASRMEARYG